MRIATYTRISTDEEHQPFSLEAQRERLSSYVKSQDDWQVAHRYSDQMTGSKLQRPGLQDALRDAGLARYDLLLVYRVDRLSRSVQGLAQILEELDKSKVTFRSATEPFDTGTAAGRMMVQMLGVFAEFERATLIDRVVAGMERKAAKGMWCGGYRPYGDRIDKEAGALVVDPVEAPVVPLIFDLYANKRLGARAIANVLNDQGHRTRHGRPFNGDAVLTLLRNRSYLGHIYFRGQYHPALHTPLVDPATYEKARTLLDSRASDYSKRASNPSDYLLSGLLICESCGKRFVGTAATGRSGRYPYYTCFTRQRYGPKACQAERLPAADLDEAIVQSLLDLFENTDEVRRSLMESFRRNDAMRPRHEEELAAAEAEIRRTEAAINRYYSAFETGEMSAAQCGNRLDDLNQQLAELRDRREHLADACLEGKTEPPSARDLAELRQHVRTAVRSGKPEQRKALLHALVDRVRVAGRNRVRPTFKIPVRPVRIVTDLVDPIGLEPTASAMRTQRSPS
jgi:site-specific DNA recombinase